MKGDSAAYAWVVVLLIVFIITFVWINLSMVYVPVLFPMADEQLAPYSEAASVMTNIKSAWNYWPLILLFGMTIYGVVSSLRRDPNAGYW